MSDDRAESKLLERFERAVKSPRLMMLYPPVCTGRPYDGTPDARTLWRDSAPSGTLYLHVPFCGTRCVFCPFYAVVGHESDYQGYVSALLAEAALYAPNVRHVKFSSVYLGGGTPSVLPPSLIARLLRELGGMLRLEGADVSLEAHPSTIDRETVRGLCDAGVTRLSLGIQSFDPRVLQACGRGVSAADTLPAVEAALDAPLRDVNVDLMYGLPEQSMESWLTDLRTLAERRVPGLTLYATVYLPAFQSRCEEKHYTVPGADGGHAMYERAYEYLAQAGYDQPRFGAGAFLRGGLNAHRRNVALGLPTLGLGTWAYSSSGAFSWHNRYPTREWSDEVLNGRLPIRQLVAVPEEERSRKFVVEALLLAGLSLDRFRDACGVELETRFPAELGVLRRLDLAAVQDGDLRLTRKGARHLREIRYLFASDAVVETLEASLVQGI
jgi:oxygen-independent coproporphyrinogen-3 oxidase